MTVDELNKIIRSGAIPGALFFFGEERFMLENRLAAIKKKLLPSGLEEFNLAQFEGKATAAEIIAAAEVLPQIGDRRLVIVKNSGLFANLTTSEFKAIKAYVPELPEYACLVFVESEFDPKKARSLKFIEDAGGGVVNFEYQPVNKLEVWVEKRLAKADKDIIARDLSYFVRIAGPSMAGLDKECRKLILYLGDERRRVTREDIDAVVPKSDEVRLYDIFGKLLAGGKSVGLAREQLARLKAENASPTMVLSVLLDQVYELLLCKLLQQDGMTTAEMLGYFDRKVPLFAVNKALSNGRRFSERALKSLVRKGLGYFTEIKTGRIDGWDAVELYASEITLIK